MSADYAQDIEDALLCLVGAANNSTGELHAKVQEARVKLKAALVIAREEATA